MAKVADLLGMTFSKLTVLKREKVIGIKGAVWLCRCECGNEKIIRAVSLVSGYTKSCGCLRREVFYKNMETHGKSRSITYSSWKSMKSRCNYTHDNEYQNYGGRGISVDSRWNDFSCFLDDMGERPSSYYSLDRIDVNGNYCKDNCRWSTTKEQGRNRRHNTLITASGVALTAAEWSERNQLSVGAIQGRLRRGWDTERAVAETPRYIDQSWRPKLNKITA